MKVEYTFDQAQGLYLARGYALGADCHFYAEGSNISELEEDLANAIETAYLDKADEFNALQESNGGFTKFQFPKAILEKVDFEEYMK